MILTGQKLQEFGRAMYGEVWISVLSRKLNRSKRTIMRWRDQSPPADVRDSLLDLTETQIAILGEIRNNLVAPFDDA